ncbi:aa3 type cytochrome c oxidase subunit IV [Tepidicaulis marinus]|jgi:hypothetical protein|uniref:Aa3 type cytochrome c oxidase subunit IV n=1 Tax=Tepidicaulis marinus TaxID=1333998 RepID=A0A081BC87_9HYPH|nr:aa3-type cytochrome c oxidase subunit IV [Tepidicaulis marinus]GAK45655.1 aa3 type cytochrome c oxidase subunit IV [Tepidicaulis marinus]
MTQENAQAGWSKEMAAEEHMRTYDGFVKGTKYGTIALTVLLILMAITLL